MRRCDFCMERPAQTRSNVCGLCRATLEYEDSLDYQVENFEQCNVCGGELSRNGHCYECIDAMSHPLRMVPA